MSTALDVEAGTVNRARSALARTDHWLKWHPSGNALLVRADQDWLREDLDKHRRLNLPGGHPDYLHPAHADLDVDGRADDAKGQAVELVTEAIGYETTALVLAVGDCCGPEAAAFVRGEGGEKE